MKANFHRRLHLSCVVCTITGVVVVTLGRGCKGNSVYFSIHERSTNALISFELLFPLFFAPICLGIIYAIFRGITCAY
jgi:hypothetical protein